MSVDLSTAERELTAVRNELAHVEHGADDTRAQQRYEAALAARNAARQASQ